MGLALIIPNINFSGANLGRVTPAEDVPLVSLSVSGPDSVTGDADAATYLPVYNPVNTNQRSVAWSVQSGGTYATITTGGVLTILQGASESPVTIRVTSSVNPLIYADKTITVTYATQPGILPDEAIPAELIYSTGYSSFIDTNIIPTARMSFEADVLWVQASGGYASFFGYNINDVRFAVHRNSAGKNEIGYGGAHQGTYPTTSLHYQRTKMRISMTESGATIETYDLAGTLLNTDSITYSASITLSQTIGLLGRKNSSTTIDSGCWRGGLGRFKLYGDANFETLVADFIPCYYQNNFGFWDAVAEEFLIGNDPANIFGFGEYWGTQGFAPNVQNAGNKPDSEYFIDYRGYDATRKFQLPSGCANVRFNTGEVNTQPALMFFNSAGEYISHFTANALDREVAVPSGAVYVRLGYPREQFANSYIYDMDGDNYIWNGGA